MEFLKYMDVVAEGLRRAFHVYGGEREVLNVYGGFLIIFERIFCRSEKML